jgi:hypothetical protein
LEEDHRYIDSSGFWKDHYSKLHLEKIALEGEVARLERLVDQLEENDLAQEQTSLNPSKAQKRRVLTGESQASDESTTPQSDPNFKEPEYTSCSYILQK